MIKVTCAIIRNDDNKVLVVQRGIDSDHPLKWEFPGGKVLPGETDEDCILREIEEELSLDIIICDPLTAVKHDYGNKKIELIPFVCDTLMDLPVLNEHADYRWVEAGLLQTIDFTAADIPVAIEYSEKFGVKTDPSPGVSNGNDEDIEGIVEMLAGKTGFGAIELVTDLAIENISVLKLLLKYSLGRDETLAFRSSYVLTKVVETDKAVIEPYFNDIIMAMPDLKNQSVIRSFLKIANTAGASAFSESEHGVLADCSFNWLNNSKSAIAIKAYAMEALYNLSEIYPELAFELSASINRNMQEGSAGIKARGRQILNKLLKR